MPDYVCSCGGRSGRRWLESLPLWAVNFHKVRSAQQPSSNLETEVISVGEKVVGVLFKEDYFFQRKKVRYEFCICKMMKRRKSIYLSVQLAVPEKWICR